MRLLALARKDVLRQTRSVFGLVMMFGAPLLITGLLYAAFGATSGGGAPQVTRVVVSQGPSQDGALRGPTLAEFLRSGGYATLFEVTELTDPEAAVAMVRDGSAAVAILVPPDFATVTGRVGARATLRVVSDPALTLGPALAQDAAQRYADAFNGAAIAAQVAAAEAVAGPQRDDPMRAATDAATSYAAWLEHRHDPASAASSASEAVPNGAPDAGGNGMGQTLALVMAGMTIFFVFFAGANGAASIVREDEEGTLRRLLATTTTPATVLGSKVLVIVATLIVQAVVLVLASALLFGIAWGRPLPLGLAILVLALAAASFGLFVMGFVGNARQTGPVLGVVLTVTGVAGGLMTTGFTTLPTAFDTMRRFTPQGWALDVWERVVSGGGTASMAGPALVSVAFAAALFAVSLPLLRRRLNHGG